MERIQKKLKKRITEIGRCYINEPGQEFIDNLNRMKEKWRLFKICGWDFKKMDRNKGIS